MLHQLGTKMMFKQLFECKIGHNLLQLNVTRSFYGNRDAVMYFIQYLRNREITVGTKPIMGKWNEKNDGRLPGMLFNLRAPNTYDFLTFNLKEWWQHKKDSYAKFVEEYQYKECIKLGPDIGAAMFIITNGGRVRFKDDDEWLDKTKRKEIAKLPREYDENYILEEMDLNGYPLRYEHLHFILGVYHLKSLNLSGCKSINDWSLDKISAEFPCLEHLDISECENVTERGLEALYKMISLRKLIVTNFHGSAAFDLSCFMLEDINPNLTCEIQQLKRKTLPEN